MRPATFAAVNAALRDLVAGAERIEAYAAEDGSGCIVFVETKDGLQYANMPLPTDAEFTLTEFTAALSNGRLPRPNLRRVA